MQHFTCFINVTAVVPLQKQSIFAYILSSLSMTLKAFRNRSFKACNFSGFLLISRSEKARVSSEVKAASSLRVISRRTSLLPFILTSQLALSFNGSESLTLLATMWPNGPWPSNTPQKTVSVLDPKFWKLNEYIVNISHIVKFMRETDKLIHRL